MKENNSVVRNSVKIILLNDENKILLMSTDDKSIKGADGRYNGCFWQLIGGSIEKNETIESAARRELFEETGISYKDVQFGPVVWYGDLDLVMQGISTHIIQRFIVARTNKERVNLKNLTQEEKFVVKGLHWFSLEDIISSKEIIYPIVLPQYLEQIINGIIPAEPIEIDLKLDWSKKI